MSIRSEYFTKTISADFFDLFVGDKLGQGVARTVFAHRLDPTVVLKFEDRARSFQNILEWEFWCDLREDDPASQWIAPCVSISPCGTILLQRRTSPITKETFPDKIPAWSTDTKISNWGMYEGRPVMHDYALRLERLPGGMKKAKLD